MGEGRERRFMREGMAWLTSPLCDTSDLLPAHGEEQPFPQETHDRLEPPDHNRTRVCRVARKAGGRGVFFVWRG